MCMRQSLPSIEKHIIWMSYDKPALLFKRICCFLTAHHISQENKPRILKDNKPDNVSGFASHMFEVKIKMESFQRKIPDFG